MTPPTLTPALDRPRCRHCQTETEHHERQSLACRLARLRLQQWQLCDRFAAAMIRHPARLCLLSVMVWYLISQIAFTNLDSYGDMIEAYVFTPFWELGTFKHPPLTGWVAKAWFAVMPHSVWAFYLLSSLGMLIGMLGVWRLADEFVSRERQALVLMALSLTLPFSTLAFKFNANSILLPIWPWLTLMFVRSLKGAHWRHAIALGVLAALGMLGKYYTGVLLVSMLATALATRSGRRWLCTPAPWLALLTFAFCLLPHVLWVLHHGDSTLAYVGRKADHHVDWKHLFSFLLSPLTYCGVAWGLMLVAAYRGSLRQRLIASLRLKDRRNDVLFWLTLSPMLITALFALSGYVKLALHWSIPLAYIMPLFWLSRASDWQPERARALLRALPSVWAGLMLLAAAFNVGQALSGKACHYRDDAGAARAIVEARPQHRLSWIGGNWPEAAIVPFFADASVRVIPGVPDQLPPGVTPVDNWQSRPGALLCRIDDAACQQKASDWLQGHGRSKHPLLISSEREGWLFPLKVPTQYLVYWY
ncbi:glycosyltransferase family 39 protein [Paludibacterium sp. THUN1379]|uniref:glycosyltransferase family 39 protein n=1 Tax=Paludibacterium sp. THUN1379 TaxID=3112107 RepID=UPI0030CE21BB